MLKNLFVGKIPPWIWLYLIHKILKKDWGGLNILICIILKPVEIWLKSIDMQKVSTLQIPTNYLLIKEGLIQNMKKDFWKDILRQLLGKIFLAIGWLIFGRNQSVVVNAPPD